MIEINLLPIDVGFDLRATGHIVMLPEEGSIAIKFLGRNNKRIYKVGNPFEIKKKLEKEGYKAEVEKKKEKKCCQGK